MCLDKAQSVGSDKPITREETKQSHLLSLSLSLVNQSPASGGGLTGAGKRQRWPFSQALLVGHMPRRLKPGAHVLPTEGIEVPLCEEQAKENNVPMLLPPPQGWRSEDVALGAAGCCSSPQDYSGAQRSVPGEEKGREQEAPRSSAQGGWHQGAQSVQSSAPRGVVTDSEDLGEPRRGHLCFRILVTESNTAEPGQVREPEKEIPVKSPPGSEILCPGAKLSLSGSNQGKARDLLSTSPKPQTHRKRRTASLARGFSTTTDRTLTERETTLTKGHFLRKSGLK